jgi:hypothetical protein
VTVPAGKYRAVRADWAGEYNGRALRSSIWYAADVGIVRMTVGDETLELKSFTPGK